MSNFKSHTYIMKRKSYTIVDCFQTIAVYLLAILFFTSHWGTSIVPSASMSPTLTKGTLLIISRQPETVNYDDIITFLYDDEAPKLRGLLGDIAIRANGQEVYVKRVIGLPGDTIEVKDGNLIRNGEVIHSDYTADPKITLYEMSSVTIPVDHYFVMGYNINNSIDSHVFGPISKAQIYGKVIWLFKFPVDIWA